MVGDKEGEVMRGITTILLVIMMLAMGVIFAYDTRPIETEVAPAFTYKAGLIHNGSWVYECTGETVYDFAYDIGTNKTVKKLFRLTAPIVEQVPVPTNEFMFVYGYVDVGIADVVSFRTVIDKDTVPVGIQYVQKAGILKFTPIYGDDAYTPKKDGCEPGDIIFAYINGQKCIETFEYAGGMFAFKRLESLTVEE